MLTWVKRAFRAEPSLFIDQKRINTEIQAERRRELYGSIDRRRRIMDRMALGYACPHASWVEECGRKARTPLPRAVEGAGDDEGSRLATA